MNTLLMDLAVGGTICVIAMFFAGRYADKTTSRAKFITIFVTVIIVLIVSKNAYLQPRYNEWRNTTNVENELAQTEPFATLKKTFPEDYNSIKEVIIKSVKARETRQEAYLKGRAVLMPILMSKMKISSDVALTGFAQSFLNTAKYYFDNGQSDLSFNIIYDQKNLPRDWHNSLPKEFIDAENANYRQILVSAADNNNRNVDKDKANKLIENISLQLYKEHGENVQLLQTPLAHPDKKEKIAKITIDFYSKILKLSESDRGMVLRQLFTN